MRPSLLDEFNRKDRNTNKRADSTTTRNGTLLEVQSESNRVVVTIDDSEPITLPAVPGAYVIGAAVPVLMDRNRKPIRVLGPGEPPSEDNPEVVRHGFSDTDLVTAELEEDMAQLGQDLAALDGELSSLNTSLSTLDTDLSTLSAELTGLEQTVSANAVTASTDAQSALEAAQRAERLAAVSVDAPTLADGSNRPVGATWTRIDGAGAQIGFWRWDGDSWEAMPLTATVIPDLSAGKITTGQFHGNRIEAGTISSNEIAASAITAGKIAANAVTADTIAASAVVAGKIAANAVTANTVAASAIVAGKIAADAVVAGTIAANAITAREIMAGSITASHLTAESVTASAIAALSIGADKIAANSISTEKIQAGAISASHLNVVHTDEVTGQQMTFMPDGMRLFAENDAGAPTISLTTSDAQNFAIRDLATDEVVAGMDATGVVTGSEVSAPLIYLDGENLADLLNDRPYGTLAKTYLSGSTFTLDNLLRGLISTDFVLPGKGARQIRLIFGLLTDSSSIQPIAVEIKFNGTSTASLGNSTHKEWHFDTQANRVQHQFIYEFNTDELGVDPNGTRFMSVLLAARTATGATGVTVLGSSLAGGQSYILVEDMGTAVPTGRQNNPGGAPTTGGASSGTATYTKQLGMEWAIDYTGSGATYNYNSARLYQGYSLAMNGIITSMMGFPNQMRSDLAGATVEYIEVYLYAAHWWSGAGGTAWIGLHTNDTQPSTFVNA